MKVYVCYDKRFPGPEHVYSRKKDAKQWAKDNDHFSDYLMVEKIKVQDGYDPDYPIGGERVVTNPSSY